MNKKFVVLIIFIIIFISIIHIQLSCDVKKYNGIWYSNWNNSYNDGTVEISDINESGFLFNIITINPHNLNLASLENKKAIFYENNKAYYLKDKENDEGDGRLDFIFGKDKLKIISSEREFNNTDFSGDFINSKPVELIEIISDEQKKELIKFISSKDLINSEDLLSNEFIKLISLEKYNDGIYCATSEVYKKDLTNELIFLKYIKFKFKEVIENSTTKYIIIENYQSS